MRRVVRRKIFRPKMRMKIKEQLPPPQSKCESLFFEGADTGSASGTGAGAGRARR